MLLSVPHSIKGTPRVLLGLCFEAAVVGNGLIGTRKPDTGSSRVHRIEGIFLGVVFVLLSVFFHFYQFVP